MGSSFDDGDYNLGVSGFDMKRNTKVTEFHIRKIFDASGFVINYI